MFKLEKLDGEDMSGHYNAHELSRVRGEPRYRIEDILRIKGNRRLVKFIGFKKPAWIPKTDIENLN